jgi:group I intron endonuclease
MNANASGIYTITSPSGGQYVGSAVKIRNRWNGHKKALRKGTHKNAKLQNAWNKYGEAAMTFAVALICRPVDLLLYEQAFIDVKKPQYNICLVAGSSFGVKRSDEYRLAKSQKLKGVKQSAELVAARVAGLIGHVVSIETRAKIGAKHIGNQHALGCARDEVTRSRMSAAQKFRFSQLREVGIVPKPHLGHTVPKETRDRISAKLKNRKRSPGAIAKHRATLAARRESQNAGV